MTACSRLAHSVVQSFYSAEVMRGGTEVCINQECRKRHHFGTRSVERHSARSSVKSPVGASTVPANVGLVQVRQQLDGGGPCAWVTESLELTLNRSLGATRSRTGSGVGASRYQPYDHLRSTSTDSSWMQMATQSLASPQTQAGLKRKQDKWKYHQDWASWSPACFLAVVM